MCKNVQRKCIRQKQALAATMIRSLPRKKKRRKSQKGKEHEVQQKLCTLWGGEKEVSTPSGRIDLLTSTEVIEIKHVSCWKGGIGQLLCYQRYYPSLSMRLHVFGSASFNLLPHIEMECKRFNIALSWEQDID
jgi:hypothetical protein